MSSRTSLRCRLVALLTVAVAALLLPGAVHAADATRYALLVGVLEYDHDKLPNLAHTENDVEELATLLKSSGFKVALLTSTRGKAREAARPTAQNIRAILKRILDRVTKHDTVLVALAGHGLQLKVTRKDAGGKQTENDEAFFCPSNAKPRDTTDPRVLSQTMIGLNELFKQLEESGAGVKLLLVDACRNDPTLGRNVDSDSLPRPPRGMAAMFSCKGGERAFESPKLGRKGHGVFFHYVLEGLRGEAKNRKGQITWDALAEYVKDKVSDEVPNLIGRGARQTPQEIKNLTGKSPVLVNPTAGAADADKLFRLALEHESGLGRKSDLVEALRCYRQASDLGHPLATATLGLFHAWGVGTRKDLETARSLCSRALPQVKEAAQKGDAVAQLLLGNVLFDGLAVDKDVVEAMKWYRKAAEQGNAAAQTNLADGYFYALGMAKDYKEAVYWNRKAAEQGNALGQYSLGWMYKTGMGVDRDLKEALRWFSKSAEQGNTLSQYELGYACANGLGAEKNTTQAASWYRKAAEGGDVTAQNWLGVMYSNGWMVEKDDREAVKWYRKAAEHEVSGKDAVKWWHRQANYNSQAAAQYNLGFTYDTGRGIGLDLKEAAKLYRQAAEKQYLMGQFALGWMYYYARGVDKDFKEAAKWYRLAADKGHANAQNLLGLMYQNGQGVEKDEKEAVRWFRFAANQGHLLGQYNLGVMYANGCGVDRDDKVAVGWYRLAADKGNAEAQNNLGWMYAQGRGVPRNLNEARNWYKKAADQGHELARKNLASLK